MPLPSRQKFRKKSICPMNGRLFSTHRVLPRGPLKLLLLLLRLCQPSPLPEPDVTRSLETWKSFRLVRNPKSFRMTVHRPPPPVFLSSRNSSLKKHRRKLYRASLNRFRRLRLQRSPLRQASPSSNWTRSMNSCWKGSLSFRPTTSGRPGSPLLRRAWSRKTPRLRHLQAVVLPPINFWRILPKKSISSASASFPQGFRRPPRTPSRRPLRNRRRPPRRLPNPARSRKCSTNFAPSWVRWARRTKISKPTTTWASRFVKWGSSRKPSANSRKLRKPAIAGEPEAALKSFSQVYAMNIDYRDVAERIAALQKPIR